MNVLFEQFPDTVEVDGIEYPVVTDFREWIKLHELFLHTQRFSLYELNAIMEWYVDKQPMNKANAVRALQDFLIAKELGDEDGYEENERDGLDSTEFRSGKPSFSFSQCRLRGCSTSSRNSGLSYCDSPDAPSGRSTAGRHGMA